MLGGLFGLYRMQQTEVLSLLGSHHPAGLQVVTVILTVFPIEADLSLVLLLALQGFVHLLEQALVGLGAVQEAAGAGFLHHLRPNEAGQLTKAVGAVHDGVAVTTLSAPQQEVTVCVAMREEETD